MNPTLSAKHNVACLMTAFFLLVIGLPILAYLQEGLNQNAQRLNVDINKTKQMLALKRDDVLQVLELRGELGDINIEKILLPTHALEEISSLKQLANTFSLTDFNYTLSRETKLPLDNEIAPVPPLVERTLSLKFNAALDQDAYAFVNKVRFSLPGRARLQELTIEHRQNNSSDNEMNDTQVSATFSWLYNAEE